MVFLMIFRRFPTTFRRFTKIFPKLFRRPDERSRRFCENFQKFPKVSDDFRRFNNQLDYQNKRLEVLQYNVLIHKKGNVYSR